MRDVDTMKMWRLYRPVDKQTSRLGNRQTHRYQTTGDQNRPLRSSAHVSLNNQDAW